MIARFESFHIGTAFDDDACRLVPEQGRELPRHIAIEHMQIRVTNACCLHLDQQLALPRPIEVDGLDAQGFFRCISYGGVNFHG